MRAFLTASVLAVAIAGPVCAQLYPHDGQRQVEPRRRKTLGFGPVHPHATFVTNPQQPAALFARFTDTNDPISVARAFADALLQEDHLQNSGKGYIVRSDSYTDKTTGVSHVYLRQSVYGVPVADGDMNLNIKDGAVLSYGSSFYPGELPPMASLEVPDVHPHAEYCAALTEQHASLSPYASTGQTPLSEEAPADVAHIHESNCAPLQRPAAMYAKEAGLPSAEALLHFMLAAAPSDTLAQDILARYDEHLQNVELSYETHLIGEEGAQIVEWLSGVPGTVAPVKATNVFVQIPTAEGTTLKSVYKYEVEMEDNWYEAYVSSAPPYRIYTVVDWASDSPLPTPEPAPEHEAATYNVFAWGVNDPSEGNRTIQKENFDSLASPMGWHSLPVANDPLMVGRRMKNGAKWRNTTTTWGNNVFAHENWEGRNSWMDNYRPDAGESKDFNFTYAPQDTEGPGGALREAKKYINATVTQLFYTSNLVHDLFYRYGFDEASGNFQQHNFGRGGQENDAVIANAQDGSGYNNANFMTPPDGQNGRCRMYLWNTASPYRDGDLEAGIVIHELGHGLSTRLTGGPANSGCLGWGESGGMGEGWGDFFATTIRSTSNYSDYPMGAWAANRDTGIRNYPYSLNDTINPSTYKTLDKPGYWGVHAIGEVWAEMLWVVSQRLIKKHGYIDTLFPPKPLENGTVPEGDFYRPQEYDAQGKAKALVPKHGNSLIIQLVVNGMKLQQCRPSFFDARDAIIQADQVLTGGENFCDLWLGFAERGMGPDARVEGRTPWGGGVRTNDYEVPLACKEEKIPEKPAPEDPEEDG